MEVHIDGSPFPIAVAEGATIGGVLDEVRRELAQRRRFAVRLVLDGAAVLLADEEKTFALPAAGHARLEIATETAETLCAQVLRDLLPFIASLKAVHRQSAEVLHMGHMREAIQGVQACVQGWEVLIRGVRHVNTILKETTALTALDPAEIRRNVAELEKSLREFRKALDGQDLARLADLVEYDLASRLPYWEDTLTTMLRKIEGGGNGGRPHETPAP